MSAIEHRAWLLGTVLALACLCGCGGSGGRGNGGSNGGALDPPSDPADSSPLITTREEARQPGTWTILIYLDADNDLESAGIANLNQMELIGSTRDVRIIAQIDRIPGQDASCGDWTDTRRYLITRDSDTTQINSIRLDDSPLGELDMGDPRTLRDFITWAKSEFPAQYYCLVIWDHGTGWQFRAVAKLPPFKYVASDDTNFNGMNVNELCEALSGLGLDVVAFDACLMQQIEVGYEIRDAARYMVGSAASEPSPGYNYSLWLSRVTGATAPADLCRTIVESYAQAYPAPRKGITQCAVDLSRMAEVASASSALAELLIAKRGESLSFEPARTASLDYSAVEGGTNRCYLDLLDYASRCAAIAGSDAQDDCDRLAAAVAAATVAETHSADLADSHGLGIYVPSSWSYSRDYERLSFARDTFWDSWIGGP